MKNILKWWKELPIDTDEYQCIGWLRRREKPLTLYEFFFRDKIATTTTILMIIGIIVLIIQYTK